MVCSQGNVSSVEKSQAVHRAGGVGMILPNAQSQAYDVTAEPYVLPAISLSYRDGLILSAYLNSVT